MGLIVQKFGGTSVGSIENILKVAERVAEKKRNGNEMVIVISAMGDSTDNLINYAYKFTNNPVSRELDVLISTGEQQSGALLSIVLNSMGLETVSMTGHQIGIITDANFKNAKILKINEVKIRDELNKGKIVVVAGFQGVNLFEEITTLGRGGSDTTAVALAAVLKADICEIYTDVEGVYSLDPNLDDKSQKFKTLSYDELLDLSFSGAKVMHPRAAELARKFNIPLVIRSSFSEDDGTIIVKNIEGLDREKVYAITLHKDEVRLIFNNFKVPGTFNDFLNELRKHGVAPDTISYEVLNEVPHVTMIITRHHLELLKKKLAKKELNFEYNDFSEEDNITTITIHGIGLTIETEIFNEILSVLSERQEKVLGINKESRKLELVLISSKPDELVKILNRKLNLDNGLKN
ncbi:MAG: aspartate kinase [bacterium]|nr:aspartate kinase [bacterium]